MSEAGVSRSTLLMVLIDNMPTKLPRQDGSVKIRGKESPPTKENPRAGESGVSWTCEKRCRSERLTVDLGAGFRAALIFGAGSIIPTPNPNLSLFLFQGLSAMWRLRPATTETIRRYVAEQSRHPVTYEHLGRTRSNLPAPGYDNDEYRFFLGVGEDVFEAGCEAIRQWKMFPNAWTWIHPIDASQLEGETVALMFRSLGLYWLSAARIIYTIDEDTPLRRFGFAYGTLPGHIEAGEELFSVEHHSDDTVWYRLKSFSKPRFWGARLAYSFARKQQRRFAKDSGASMLEFVKEKLSEKKVMAPVRDLETARL
jgi:uncharacterized protein (UPF0548 family)